MNSLDYVLAGIVVFFLVRGVFRGLIKELSSIVGVLGGIYAAYTYYPQVAGLLARWITNPGYLNIISFLILFATVCLAVSIACVIIKYLMNITFLGWTDRIGGGIFAATKGILITAVLILVLTAFLPKNTTLIRQSLVAQNMMQLSAVLIQVAPEKMKHSFGAKMKELNKTWHPKKL